MEYRAALTFFQKILHNFQIDTHIFSETTSAVQPIDRGLRAFLHMQADYDRIFSAPWAHMQPNTVYKAKDSFFCKYFFILLPGTAEPTVLIGGPYITEEVTAQALLEQAERHNVPTHIFSQIEKYCGNLPCVSEETTLDTLLNTLGETLWGGMDNFTVQTAAAPLSEHALLQIVEQFPKRNDDALLAIQSLEMRYDAERRLMQAVSQGMTHKAEQMICNASKTVLEMRTTDTLRNTKNYCIIMNTLLRKSAEYGSVHPFYIDSVSSDFAKRIERVQSPEEFHVLQREMVYAYCTLVNKHSTKQYSPLVQKVLTVIDSDLTADLSLKHLAKLLSVNASYLSTLFKKETGKTITEFVTQKRMEQAVFLLRTTKLQVQTVAQHCGIYDVNYFTKLFKKFSGKTPKEFREQL
ncbi:MAG: helix-turn-helix domain-containing protein [Candidatus Fimenecus sp.]